MNCQRCNRPMANRYKAKTYNHAFVCSVCQFLNKFTAIRYMLRVRIADNENSIEELSIHRSKLIQDCTLKLFNEYIAIADRLDK